MEVFPFSLYLLWYFDGIWTPPSSDCCFLTMAYDTNDFDLSTLDWLHLQGFDVRSMVVTSGGSMFRFVSLSRLRIDLSSRSRSSFVMVSMNGIQKDVFTYCPSSWFIPPNFGALLCLWISRDSRTDLSKWRPSVLSIVALAKSGPAGQVLACWAAPDLSHCSLCM